MAVFALGFFLWLRRRPLAAASHGFYLFAGFYGLQRFLWEFLKPYPEVAGPFNVFHLAAGALVIYAAVMLRVARPVHAVA
jgi:prolipoprotein diacylglyceryltransferase